MSSVQQRARQVAAIARRVGFSHAPALAAAGFGGAYFVALTDVRVLDPRRVSVVAERDLAFHVIAQSFARWDGWHWPVTRITNYSWPVGTTSVYTDANPWVTLLAKALLPSDGRPIQLVGIWLALCFALQGYWGARLCTVATRNAVVAALGGALFALAPVLALRLEHDALCAHWLILAAMTAALRPPADGATSRRELALVAAVLTFAAGLHPTLFAMTLPIGVVAASRHAMRAGAAGLPALAACVVGPAFVWIAFGTLAPGVGREVYGFGTFSANLLTLVDPYERAYSALLPALPHDKEQYEGFGYLGLGVLVALLGGAVAAARVRRIGGSRTTWALFAVAAALAVYALSSRVTFGTKVVVDLDALYRPLHAVTNAFRSSGRFIWPMHYLLVFAAVASMARLRSPWDARALGAIVALQAIDLRHIDGRVVFSLNAAPPPPSPTWSLAAGDYARMVLDPPDIQTNRFACDGARYGLRDFLPLADIASRARLAFNSGQAARVDDARLRAYCADVSRDRREGTLDARTVYVPAPAVVAEYRARPEMACGRIDAWDVCVRADRPTPLLAALVAEARTKD